MNRRFLNHTLTASSRGRLYPIPRLGLVSLAGRIASAVAAVSLTEIVGMGNLRQILSVYDFTRQSGSCTRSDELWIPLPKRFGLSASPESEDGQYSRRI